MRFFLGALASLFWVYTLQNLSLFDGVSLQCVAPVVTVLGSVFWLGEKVTWVRFWSILFSVLGGVFIIWGRSDGVWGGVAWLPIVASLCCAGVNLLSKKIFQRSNVLLVTCQQMLFNGIVFLPSYFWHHPYDVWQPVSVHDMGALFVLSLCAVMAHLCLHFAIFFTDLVVLMPLGGVRPLLTIFFGLFFLGERPALLAFCGTIMVVLSLSLLSCTSQKPS